MIESERTILFTREPSIPTETNITEANIAIVRHLEDVNDLIEGRDTGLVSGQE
jgi:hypothetical protein